MKLKTATLIVLIGQVVALAYWQIFSIFQLYSHLNYSVQAVLNLIVAVIGQGSIILFFAVLYYKQKGSPHE